MNEMNRGNIWLEREHYIFKEGSTGPSLSVKDVLEKEWNNLPKEKKKRWEVKGPASFKIYHVVPALQ